MKILSLNTQHNKTSSANFNGLSQVINSQNVSAFFKKTQKLADVDIFQKTYEKGKLKLKPTKVALVKFKVSNKGDKHSKIFYSLFEQDYASAKTLQELDSKELGLIEVKYKNLKDATLQSGSEREISSVRALKKAYHEGLKILHLISYEGDKYKGIGTKLLDTAVAKSQEMGLGGKTFLYAKNLFPNEYLKNSSFCKKMAGKQPTNFYYKYGFRADDLTNKIIENGENIDSILMHLPIATLKEKISSLQIAK